MFNLYYLLYCSECPKDPIDGILSRVREMGEVFCNQYVQVILIFIKYDILLYIIRSLKIDI